MAPPEKDTESQSDGGQLPAGMPDRKKQINKAIAAVVGQKKKWKTERF